MSKEDIKKFEWQAPDRKSGPVKKISFSAYPETLKVFSELERITGENRSLLIRYMADRAGCDLEGFVEGLSEYRRGKTGVVPETSPHNPD